jgi:hypothetical protein
MRELPDAEAILPGRIVGLGHIQDAFQHAVLGQPQWWAVNKDLAIFDQVLMLTPLAGWDDLPKATGHRHIGWDLDPAADANLRNLLNSRQFVMRVNPKACEHVERYILCQSTVTHPYPIFVFCV